ncbi:hypothetical protein D1159_15515 [Pseudoflavonifractor sp. 524-17]|uniref:hypothetical protein n=1 Tax=Pseudoflavonifractor sp. 524-17 TaxID=2304577 RepID=UPI00137955AB|nr:hypothetical protein [Pseudoflavonifractor sp. 524-17]NCE65948.1 hypothetical protein [Pseudoflavonifractor sp. 524-17]
MVIEKKFNSISELSALQHIASMADKEVYLASQDESIKVDARSFIGLFALDYTKPLKVITDSLYVIRMMELDLRHAATAFTH